MDQKRFHDTGSVDRNFDVGQTVLVRNLRDGPKWFKGMIVEKSGPISYRVDVQGQIWSRHTDQLLKFNCKGVLNRERVTTPDPCVEVTYEPPPVNINVTDSSPQSTPQFTPSITFSSPLASDPKKPTHSPHNDSVPPRYPSRVRKPPERLEVTFD